jgi:hypothetical protein
MKLNRSKICLLQCKTSVFSLVFASEAKQKLNEAKTKQKRSETKQKENFLEAKQSKNTLY